MQISYVLVGKEGINLRSNQ